MNCQYLVLYKIVLANFQSKLVFCRTVKPLINRWRHVTVVQFDVHVYVTLFKSVIESSSYLKSYFAEL